MCVTDKCIHPGRAVAAAVEAGVQTRICDQCGASDVDAWNVEEGIDRCEECVRPLTGGKRPCSVCGLVMRVIIMGGCFLCSDLLREHDLGGEVADCGQNHVKGDHPPHSSYHLLETPGGIDRMHEVEIPTEEYYQALRKSMGERHPKACNYLLDHLLELEAMFDVCIVSWFSMGIPKAILAATSGPMLGDNVGRHGRTPNGERVQGVWEFAPLKKLKQMQQFLGCCNWLRNYMAPLYSQLIKILRPYLKEETVYPPEGLGPGITAADKAIRGLKLLAK